MRQYNFCLVLVLWLVCISLAVQQGILTSTIKPLELDMITRDNMTANSTNKYVVPIAKTYKTGDWHFVVMVNPKRYQSWERTEIKIYKLNDQHKESLTTQCSEVGVDACLINKNRIYDNDTVYVDVKCYDNCEYQIRVYWVESVQLTVNQPIILDFEQKAQALTFSLDLEGKEFEELRIHLSALTDLDSSSPIHLLANYGRVAPTAAHHDLKGVHLWSDGQGIFVHNADLKQRFLTILVEGPANNLLSLSADLITHHPHKLFLHYLDNLFVPTVDYLRESTGRTYFVDLPDTVKSLSQDIIFRLLIYTGGVEVNFYSDQKLNNMITSAEFEHLGDLQYKFGMTHLEKNNVKNKLYMKVDSPHFESAFLIFVVLQEKNMPLLLFTGVSEISELYKDETDLYYIKVFIRADEHPEDIMTVEFVLHNLTGSSHPVFHICEADPVNCSSNLAKTFNKPDEIRLVNFSESFNGRNSTQYKVNLNTSDFSVLPEQRRVKYLTLVILVWTSSEQSRYSISYINHIYVHTLKENIPLRHRLVLGEQKYYTVRKLGPDVKSVTVRLTEISGTTLIKGYRADPRGKQLSLPSTNTTEESIIFKEHLEDQPIFIIANGEENSLFLLTLTIEREQKNDTSIEHFNYIVVSENILQQIAVASNETMFIRIHPSTENFHIVLDSSLEVSYCATTIQYKRPVPPNCGITLKNGINNITHSGVMYIGITNQQTRRVLVRVDYMPSLDCENRRVGHIWRRRMQNQKSKVCVKYILPYKEDLQIMVQLASKHYDTMHVTYNFGASSYTYLLDEPSITFLKHEQQKACPKYGPCQVTITVSNISYTEIEVLVQYINREVTLLDGIALKVEGTFLNGVYKHFKFHMANKIPTAIIVEGKVGQYTFYVNIVDEDQMHKLNQTEQYPTKTAHDFNSTNDYYTMYNTLYLSAENLEKVNCLRCLMFVSVCLNSNDYESHGKYIIEITQQVRYLKEHSQSIGYLQKHSMALYEYYLPEDNRSMIISLSTENTDCAMMYLAKGEQKPASASYYIKQIRGEELVYKGDKGTYSIMVEALDICRYTISASSTGMRLYEITNGVYRDIKLKANQIAYFFYENLVGLGFKVMSLENYGEILIQANVTNSTYLENLDNETNVTDFSWASSKDILIVSESEKDKNICEKCMYLIVVKALKDTETSLIISSPGTEIPISVKRDITDVLEKDQSTQYRIHDQSKLLNFSVEVYYGQVTLNVSSDQNNETHTFKPSNKTQVWSFEQFKNDPNPKKRYIASKVKIVAKADKNTMYKMFINSTENQFNARRLKHGVPSYVFLAPNEEECYESTGSGPIRVLVTVSEDAKDKLPSIKLTLKTSNRQYVGEVQQPVENTMLVAFLDNFTATNYTVCFKSKELISMTVVPVASINILGENTYMYISKQESFSLATNGPIILEVFECEGSTSVLFANKFGDLSGDDSELKQWRHFGANYLVQIEHYGPVYLNVDGRSRVRWMHVDVQKGQGIGYYNIRTPHFIYMFHEGNTVFHAPSLIQDEHVKLNITEIAYSLIISDSHKKVKEATHCSSQVEIYKSHQVRGKAIEEMIKFVVDQKEIEKAFENSNKQQLFAAVKAIATIITKSGKTQKYTFIDNILQLPRKINNIATQTSNGSGFWVTLGTLLALVLGILFLICLLRFIRLHIRKRRRDILLKTEQQSAQSSVNDVELKYASFGTAN